MSRHSERSRTIFIARKRLWRAPLAFVLLLCTLQLLLLLLPTITAYRLGDVVDTDLVIDGVASDALRNQRPLFGIDSKTTEPFVSESIKRSFSLQFEEGLWTLPTASLKQNGESLSLEAIQVRFVYSRSGVGAIHAVQSNAVYGPSSASAFYVEYHWIAEEAVHLQTGFTVMFLAVLVASVFFIMTSCGMLLESSTTNRNSNYASQQQQSHGSISSPKWD